MVLARFRIDDTFSFLLRACIVLVTILPKVLPGLLNGFTGLLALNSVRTDGPPLQALDALSESIQEDSNSVIEYDARYQSLD